DEARARELRCVRGHDALAMGLVDKVVADHEVLETSMHWARQFASGAVVAMGIAKRAIDGGLGRPLGDGLDLERDAFVEVFATEDARTGIRSFRADGPGKAKFSGR
ncbi:MAG TPA: enoyl-CoA hydratase-related protein, partial [Acidimicrobiia bacterium]|nr:enoyl-CoA hydratase-related protein [Acidimicrobiia bacterium]